jgi:hypothetical protein
VPKPLPINEIADSPRKTDLNLGKENFAPILKHYSNVLVGPTLISSVSEFLLLIKYSKTMMII